LPDLRRVAVAAVILASTLLASALGGLAQTAGRLSMTVTGLRSNDGVVRCALHNSPAAFPKAGQEWRGVIAPIRDRQATCVFSGVPAGNYAVAFFHAEHNETQLTPGLFGKPPGLRLFQQCLRQLRPAGLQCCSFPLRRRKLGAAGFADLLIVRRVIASAPVSLTSARRDHAMTIYDLVKS
jgi:uncharacterized protein (DUF2141 family)